MAWSSCCWRQLTKTEELYVFLCFLTMWRPTLSAWWEYCDWAATLRVSSYLFTGFKVVREKPLSSTFLFEQICGLRVCGFCIRINRALRTCKFPRAGSKNPVQCPLRKTNARQFLGQIDSARWVYSAVWVHSATNLLLWQCKVSSFITSLKDCLKRCLGSVSEGVLRPPGGSLDFLRRPFRRLSEACGSVLRPLGRLLGGFLSSETILADFESILKGFWNAFGSPKSMKKWYFLEHILWLEF